MIEPWNLKVEDTRHSDNRSVFIIFCEDGEIEPEYFNLFETDLIKVSAIRNSGKHHRQINFASEYCRDNDLIETVNGNERLKLDKGAQVWCVYDRDKEENDRMDSSFNDSIRNAELKGMRVAWSNDDFEVWILLHFQEIAPADPLYRSRDTYYGQLTAYFNSVESLNEFEAKVTKNPGFDYYRTMKRKKRFLSITVPHLKGKLDTAIARAQVLEEYFNKPELLNHEKAVYSSQADPLFRHTDPSDQAYFLNLIPAY